MPPTVPRCLNAQAAEQQLRYIEYIEALVSWGEAVRMRRAFGDALWSAAAVMLLLGTLVTFDDRVRDQLFLRFGGGASDELTTAGAEIKNFATVLFEAVRDQSIDHSPLMIFALAATVLVLFMLRT